MKTSKYGKEEAVRRENPIPPRPKSSYLYMHGSKEYNRNKLLQSATTKNASTYNIINPQSNDQGKFERPKDTTLGYTGYKPKYNDP